MLARLTSASCWLASGSACWAMPLPLADCGLGHATSTLRWHAGPCNFQSPYTLGACLQAC